MDPIAAVEAEIVKVADEIQAVGAAIAACTDKDTLDFLWKKKLLLRKEKEQLRKEKEQLREEKLILLRKDTDATRADKPKSFSSVALTEAELVLHTIGIRQCDGRRVANAELQVPPGTAICDEFDVTPYRSEDEATPRLLQHHQEQLERLGVKFDVLGGFQMFDVHNRTSDSLTIYCGGQTYRGIFDGCVAPYGLMGFGSLEQSRIIYEHKRQPQKQSAKAQGIMKLLAANAYGPCPVMLDVTDGNTHDVYTIRGKRLITWAGLDPTQAYYLQAQHLQANEKRALWSLELEEIPEEEQVWMRKLHELRPVSGLKEQLDSIIPFLPPEERIHNRSLSLTAFQPTSAELGLEIAAFNINRVRRNEIDLPLVIQFRVQLREVSKAPKNLKIMASQTLCHSGPCPNPEGCSAEVSVRCSCPNKHRAKWKCSKLQAALECAGQPLTYDDVQALRLLLCDAECELLKGQGRHLSSKAKVTANGPAPSTSMTVPCSMESLSYGA
ncbi:hypothetical protein VOLCADRAFT_105184 [Volvox carteri f. nagariensis]|uniref:Uncharacterized protein n=1 Tax=Volvox carteri f. nagariensis TaxID=3068 RepID=D8TZ33_VOLCA|nr:uncharacterized protein VOLCADRAFT_105184 [Volvox carteri f. nagariensis]EFJ47110.1 hypothetical protein VOLCADRAFT_105184 [Volvox carteri f. nagariensis]|eukprot:XP_002951659.1 hypothetical protein VOLCADRAFT_105184 [Volvox carteri f. nagariensis]